MSGRADSASGLGIARNTPNTCPRMKKILLVALAALAACSLVVAEEAPRIARIVEPGVRTIAFGSTEVRVELPEGVEVAVSRLVGPGRWERLDPDEEGRRFFDAGSDLGPETLRAISYSTDAEGVRRRLGEDVLTTSLYPAPDVVATPLPTVEVSLGPGPASEEEPQPVASLFDCSFAGEPCRVREVEPLERGTLYVSLLVDVSGSMCLAGQQVAASLHALLDEFEAEGRGVRFRVVEFAERRQALLGALQDAADRDRMLYRFEDDVERVREQLESMACGGGTALWSSIYEELLDMDLRRDETRVGGASEGYALVVVSDGVNTVGDVDAGQVSRLVGSLRIPVFPILLGTQTDAYLLQLGKLSGGRGYRDSVTISAALSDIGRTLSSRFRLVFEPSEELKERDYDRALELAYPGRELAHPRYWSPPETRLSVARSVLRRSGSGIDQVEAAVDAVRRFGSARDAARVFERFREAIMLEARRQRFELDPGWRLEDAERALGLQEDWRYLRFRARVFYAVFSACSRSLLHERDDRREQRRAARVLEDVEELIVGERYSLEHVMGPVIDAYLDPDFPSDANARERLAKLSDSMPEATPESATKVQTRL